MEQQRGNVIHDAIGSLQINSFEIGANFRNALNERRAAIDDISHEQNVFRSIRLRFALVQQAIRHVFQFSVHFHKESDDFVVENGALGLHVIDQFV